MHNSWLRVNSAASTYTQVRDRTGDVPCGHSREGVSNQGLADKNGLTMDTSIHFSFSCVHALTVDPLTERNKKAKFCLKTSPVKHDGRGGPKVSPEDEQER
ncbi:hypothetical protein OUZ56_008541 [Daphnia magna]|uniref:Uncharacterized protein n=1 Tax=Daphnia magna TaxID=35525 RepID=A0ABR0ADI9_9CRUS|nr:hypothetical protein OUZ56_008541 [Daphnia magna]